MPRQPGKGSLVVVFLTVFIDLVGFGMVLPLLPVYARQYTVDQTGLVLGLLMSSFSAMQFLFAPLWGRLSDRIGRRPVLLTGLAGSVVFYSLFGIATVYKNLALVFVSRVGAGIAGATIPTAQAYIADSTPAAGRAKGMALVGAAFGLGFTFGPLFGYLAVPSGQGDPGPGPGYAAAGLSLVALIVAFLALPESLNPAHRAPQRKLWDLVSLRDALATPSVGLLVLASFVCVFSFANFESTLSLLVKDEGGRFRFDFRQVCLLFAYIGFVLALAQGVVVRRLSGRVAEGLLAQVGAVVEVLGFFLLGRASVSGSAGSLRVALLVVVCGFALVTPALNSLISRRSDPAKQGGILGLTQSANSLARILGPMVGVPLLHRAAPLPYWTAACLMAGGFVLVLAAARRGRDFGT